MNDSNHSDSPSQVFDRLGAIVRSLHDTLRELGAEGVLTDAATAFPSARERLHYIGDLTEKAANTVLNKVDEMAPRQQQLSTEAVKLREDWRTASGTVPDALQPLVDRTGQFLAGAQSSAEKTRADLSEIMMAQDFQDLTGQLIRKVVGILEHTEQDLLKLLIDAAPPGALAQTAKEDTMSGPIAPAAGGLAQADVDDLLADLGF